MTRKKKCNSESNSFVEAAEQVCLQPVLEHRQRRGRRNIAWQAIPHLCSSSRKGTTSNSWPTTGPRSEYWPGWTRRVARSNLVGVQNAVTALRQAKPPAVSPCTALNVFQAGAICVFQSRLLSVPHTHTHTHTMIADEEASLFDVWCLLLRDRDCFRPVLCRGNVAKPLCRLSLLPLLTNTMPDPSASEVTTLWHYKHLFVIIIIIIFFLTPVLNSRGKKKLRYAI